MIRAVQMKLKQGYALYSPEIGLIVLETLNEIIKAIEALGISLKQKILVYVHGYQEITEVAAWLSVYNYTRTSNSKMRLAPGEYKVIAYNYNVYSLLFKRDSKDTKFKALVEYRDSTNILNNPIDVVVGSFGLEWIPERYLNREKLSTQDKTELKTNIVNYYKSLEMFWSFFEKEKLTIGGLCWDDFIKDQKQFNSRFFPNLGKIELKRKKYGSDNADEYCRKAYWGGTVLSKPGYYKNGCIIDATAMYPSQMHSSSGNIYPKGAPNFWTGEIPGIAKKNLFIVRVEGVYKLKPNKIGWITAQRLNMPEIYQHGIIDDTRVVYGYDRVEHRWKDKEKQAIYDFIEDSMKGGIVLTFTSIEWAMFLESYEFYGEILDGCWFETTRAQFDNYIEKWNKLKEENRDINIEMFTTSKLMLNNLGGQLGKRCDSLSFNISEDGISREGVSVEYDQLRYCPTAAFMTAYGRRELLRVGNKNISHVVGGDTDSLLLDCKPSELVDVEIGRELGKWKVEARYDELLILKNKTYIYREGSSYTVKASGMPQRCNKNLLERLDGMEHNFVKDEMEADWCKDRITIKEIKELDELSVPGYFNIADTSVFNSTFLLKEKDENENKVIPKTLESNRLKRIEEEIYEMIMEDNEDDIFDEDDIGEVDDVPKFGEIDFSLFE